MTAAPCRSCGLTYGIEDMQGRYCVGCVDRKRIRRELEREQRRLAHLEQLAEKSKARIAYWQAKLEGIKP